MSNLSGILGSAFFAELLSFCVGFSHLDTRSLSVSWLLCSSPLMLSGPLRSLLVTINYRRRMKQPWLPTERWQGREKGAHQQGEGKEGWKEEGSSIHIDSSCKQDHKCSGDPCCSTSDVSCRKELGRWGGHMFWPACCRKDHVCRSYPCSTSCPSSRKKAGRGSQAGHCITS
jgi:hypothetical protein